MALLFSSSQSPLLSQYIAPFKEIVAYEALWGRDKTSFKSLAELFAKTPGSRPSDYVSEDDMSLFWNEIKTLIFDDNKLKYPTNILINGTLDYPVKLKDAKYPVEILYYSGNLAYLHTRSIAIVGSRHPSEDGIKRAKKLVNLLVDDGVTIVSGLASGIDTIAHTSAMQRQGRTIAVIGTAINQVYPKDNRNLQETIAKDHLLISQVPFYRYKKQGAFGNRLFFPERNKTMSALTEATVIIEASDTSGTLIQAKAAIEQGRKLFILASCFDKKSITWPEKFLKLGAIRVESYDDIRKPLLDK